MSGRTKREKNYTRIKEQKILQKECEITRSDCEEFIRVVKRFGKSFAENDLAQYCRLNNIPISEHTIECMFEEFFLNKKNERESREITADDLISLTSKKTNRCFYVPVVVYIGKCNHIRSYEEGLINAKERRKKNEQIERDNWKRQIERDKRNRQKNEQMNYVWEDELWGRSNCCREAMSTDPEGKLELGSTHAKTTNGDSTRGCQDGEENGGVVPNGETDRGEPSPREANRANAEQPHAQVDSPNRVEAIEKKEGKQSSHSIKNNNNTNNSAKMKKSAPGRKGKRGQGGKAAAAHQEKKTNGPPPAEETKQHSPEEQNTDKQIYYDFLMQRVLNNIEKKKERKKKHLKTFNFVTYYKLHELIYTSFLVDKYKGYFNAKEESNLIDIYAEEGKKMDPSEDGGTGAPGETTKDSGEADGADKMQASVEDMKRITLADVVQKYEGDREKEEKKKKKLKKKTHKYIHSNNLANYQFVGKNIEGIMSSVLHNLNLFFNDNVLDVEPVMEQYSTVVRNVCDAAESGQGDVCKQVVIPIDADKAQEEIPNGDNTLSGKLIEGNEKASVPVESLPLNEEETATVISAPTCASLPRLKNRKKCTPNGEVVTFDQTSETVRKMKKEDTKGDDNPKCAEGEGGAEGQGVVEDEAKGPNTNIKRGRKAGRAKRMHLFKRPPGTHQSEIDEGINAPCDVQLDNEAAASDHSISYANLKYTKEEIKQKNLIYYLTHDINQIETFKRKYFYDFFFMYMVRKLFWNVLCLYYLLWKERLSNDAPMQNSSPGDATLHQSLSSPLSSSLNSQGLDDANLILYESDVSVNNAKKDKTMLYNTNQKLCHNLDPLFKLIRKEKLLIYLRYDKNKRVKCKNKTEYLYREIWQYLILTNLRQKAQTGTYSPMPPKERKTKEQIAAAAAASGRSKKKKWGKGKNKEKLNHAVFIDKALQSKILESKNMKVITPSTISEKYKVNLSVARSVIKYLAEQNLIKEVCMQSHSQKLYTKVA
ncbi:hypothetical protein C922_03642 [Plasmodium inui San Antonio 1]|uniref:40S ribosomal protein S25 n=1 Tax=Plasmodium inui San Antonio 1 TaxID=1237626 RepID=W7A3J9_9APIC|nr:hypothetical protein C922_03642 [Plasmodium inui San Antonio 1]EUD65918.1 hypothetical protein C922_03642 [Plasmodium inui San Antonio 1]